MLQKYNIIWYVTLLNKIITFVKIKKFDVYGKSKQ